MSHTEQGTRRQSWELLLTQQEIDLLRRERTHLLAKATERPLSPWEEARQQQIFHEVSGLLRRTRLLVQKEEKAESESMH